MTRVLIADDHEVVRRGLKDLLNDAFDRVQFGEARTAQEALDLAQRQDWDIVLLDLNMPGRGGLEILADLKGLRPRQPVLVLSAFPEQDYALRALKLGASGYLTKQSASDELLAAIRKSLAGGKYVTASLAERLAEQLSGEAPSEPHEALSPRELQVLRFIATGKTVKEIAAELSLSEKTIGTYRTRISEKLRLSTNVEITRYALQHKLVD
jgi:DNA-binding NarL/FixJ family response regulator